MSADAASLPCPVCSHTSVFNSVQSLRDRLIHVSTNKISCPVCQEEISGLDKLTIHLFCHVQLLTTKQEKINDEGDIIEKVKSENGTTAQQKKPKSGAKNKISSSAAAAPVKFVKIYPKLPVISLNPVPIIEITQKPDDGTQTSNPIQFVKTETALLQNNTTCNICGLQFVDNNILKMHRCLIHNIDETTHQAFTRYNCHLCPKNFKMRGSLMVHLRVAHFGFLSGNNIANDVSQNSANGNNLDENQDNFRNNERNDTKQWQCDVCKKCFTTKYFLKKHKRLHTGETPYACSQCNKTFTFQQSYHKHLLYHNDEKPHTCSYCGRAFKELSTLHNHQRIHTGEKPFACETCGKCFRQRVSYLVHRRIHTGVMPYKCTACEKSFRYKVSQRTHKCQAQPPGTVVRQTGDLVEKLKKKQPETESNGGKQKANNQPNTGFIEVSEASAELIRSGAKLSLEDMESENFSIISESLHNDLLPLSTGISDTKVINGELCLQSVTEMFHHTDIDLIDTIPIENKNVPSPSEILKNLSLSKEDDYSTVQDKKLDIFNEFNIYL